MMVFWSWTRFFHRKISYFSANIRFSFAYIYFIWMDGFVGRRLPTGTAGLPLRSSRPVACCPPNRRRLTEPTGRFSEMEQLRWIQGSHLFGGAREGARRIRFKQRAAGCPNKLLGRLTATSSYGEFVHFLAIFIRIPNKKVPTIRIFEQNIEQLERRIFGIES